MRNSADYQESFWRRLHVRPWLLPVGCVLAGALVGTVISVRRTERVEVTEVQKAPTTSVSFQSRSVAEISHDPPARAAIASNPAAQRAGPADPRAEQSSANSAEAAAKAAADLAASAPSPSN